MEINIKLKKNFTTQYNKLQSEYGEEVARINGFADEQLSYTDFIDNFVDNATIADTSIDGNSNVRNKSIVSLEREMPKPHEKLLAFNKIHYEMQKKYGFQTANEWLRSIWVGQLYLHDSDSSSRKHYCFAYDLTELVEKGLYFLEERNSKPAEHLSTFVDFVKEFISYTSNLSSGAVGLPNVILYMYYYWDKDVKDGYYIKSPEYYAKQSFQRFIYALNQPYTRDGSQSAFVNTSVFDRSYFEALFGGVEFPNGEFAIDHIEEFMQFQKWFLEVMSEIRSENVFTFPVNTISLLSTEDRKGFVDNEFAEWAIKHNMKWSDSNLFVDNSVNSLSNCCRLKSDIKELYFNSIGGSALKVGSVKVSTINLARLALDTNSPKEYLKELEDRVELNCKVLDIIRHIIKRNVEKGLLPNFTHGLVDFEHLYSTHGVIGIYETMKKFGFTEKDEFGNTYYKYEAFELGKQIFDTIRRVSEEFKEQHKCEYNFNIEQIPGESAAAKLMKLDKFFYPNANIYDLPLYGNQFLPLGIQSTLQERVEVASAFDKFCSGGSILHVNIDAPFDTYEKCRSMIDYIIGQGITYFAFNTKIQACKDNHGFYGTTCPKCGKPIFTEYTRIVGFYTPIQSYSKERKAEYQLRRWMPLNQKGIDNL